MLSNRIASAPCSESFFQLRQRAHFDFDRLRTAPVAMSSLQHGCEASRQGNVIVLDEYAVRKI